MNEINLINEIEKQLKTISGVTVYYELPNDKGPAFPSLVFFVNGRPSKYDTAGAMENYEVQINGFTGNDSKAEICTLSEAAKGKMQDFRVNYSGTVTTPFELGLHFNHKNGKGQFQMSHLYTFTIN
jgi:hypothetical protein